MENKNITFNCTLEQYNKKYRNRRHRLLKYTKKQVEDFDKQYGHYVFNGKTHNLEFNHYILKNRKWVLIGDTYYEIPKPVRLTWFRNLSVGVQATISALGIVGVTSAIVFPTLAVTVWNKKGTEIKLEYLEKLKIYYSKDPIVIEANKRYYVKNIDIMKLGEPEDEVAFAIGTYGTEKKETKEYAKDWIVKSNKRTFELVDTLEGLDDPKYKYCIDGDEETGLEIGKGSFNTEENLCSFSFVAAKSGTVTIGIMGGER